MSGEFRIAQAPFQAPQILVPFDDTSNPLVSLPVMVEEIRFPQEGMLTLGAQFTKSTVDKVLHVVKQLIQKGWSAEKIFAKMKADLSLDEHTLHVIFEKAAGRDIADDIASDNVASERELRPGTVEVIVHKPVTDVEQTGLLRYRGEEWYIGVLREKTLVLKRLI